MIHLSHSTISSALNAMSLVILEDLIKKKITLTDAQATKISKVVGERQSCSNVKRVLHLYVQVFSDVIQDYALHI